MPLVTDPANPLGWNRLYLRRAWPGFQMCPKCKGQKVCATCCGTGIIGSGGQESACPENCSGQEDFVTGWCTECGGAGQRPLDESVPYFAPERPRSGSA